MDYSYIGKQAGKLAKDRGWAINIGGGFHHCYSTEGGGFCIFADISLCVKVHTWLPPHTYVCCVITS